MDTKFIREWQTVERGTHWTNVLNHVIERVKSSYNTHKNNINVDLISKSSKDDDVFKEVTYYFDLKVTTSKK